MRSFVVAYVMISALGSVRGNSEVMESHEVYSCCNSTIRFNPRCENTWYIDNKTFGSSRNRGCIPPCKNIEPGLMTLDGCAALNSTVVCTNDMNVPVETKIYYSGQRCPDSLLNVGSQVAAGSVGLLLTVMIGGLIVKEMICLIISNLV